MNLQRRCKCGNSIGDNTPANKTMCMECWTAAKNRPAGQQQADTPPDRPGNPHATIEIEAGEKVLPFGMRLIMAQSYLAYNGEENR